MTIQVICAWCKKDMGVKDGQGVEGVSHGICAECAIGQAREGTCQVCGHYGLLVERKCRFYCQDVVSCTERWSAGHKSLVRGITSWLKRRFRR